MKKRSVVFICTMFLLFVALACSVGPLTIDLGGKAASDGAADAGESGAGGLVEVGINAPVNGTMLPMGPVEIAYYATSTDGIATIELSVNGEVKNSMTSPDASQQVVASKYSWEPAVSGSHTIRVRAMSAKGAWSDYSAVTVNVESPPQAAAPADAQPAQPAAPKPTDTPAATATPEEPTIFNVKQDVDEFFYNGGSCGPREMTISADITHPDEIYAVVIYIRFWDNEGAGFTPWDSGRAMSKKSDTHFSRTIFSEDVPNYNAFDYAVMYYQLVAENERGERVTATEVFKRLQLNYCP